VYLIVTALIAITIVVAALVLVPRLMPGRVVFDASPDRPYPFGYKMSWLAIRTGDTAAVVDALAIEAPELANWRSGIGTVYCDDYSETHVFVSPPVEGWTFVIGLALPHPLGRSFLDKSTQLLLDLGGRFPEVQYFFTYPLIDFFAWARIDDGKLTRAFAVGDEGTLWNKGKITREETSLGLKLFELRGVRGRRGEAGGEILMHPTEEHVLMLASRWSLDPTRVDQCKAGPALGYIGRAPAAWRPERLRKAA
jgi:hypothetical protein